MSERDSKTANTCIANVEAIIEQFADKLTGEGRADLAAVVAMARQWAIENDKMEAAIEGDWTRHAEAETARIRNMTPLDKALAAAGVEVNCEG